MSRLVLCALLAGAALSTQTPQAAQTLPPVFEVASVKPNDSNSGNSSTDDRNGGFTAVNMALRRLIAIAYRLHPVLDRDRVVGPGWIDTARFDINAKAPPNTPIDRIPDLLRALLAERFKMVARTELREAPIYALVLARPGGKFGPRLTPSSLDCSKPDARFLDSAGVNAGSAPIDETPRCGLQSNRDANGAIIRGGGRTMGDLAKNLTGRTDRPVIDRTGLTGAFDFVLQFTPEGLAPRADPSTVPRAGGQAGPSTDGTSLFTALQEQLGLKLEAQRSPVEFIVIDHIERPSPN